MALWADGNQTVQDCMQKIGILGAGAWGTALAQTAALAGRDVTLWAREPDVVDAISKSGENSLFLPGIPLSDKIAATGSLADLAGMDAILLVTPAQHIRRLTDQMMVSIHAKDRPALVICAKGIEIDTGELLSSAVAAVAPQCKLAVLSGPTFASEAARGMPTAVTLACADKPVGEALIAALGRPAFRPYYSPDPIGAQVGGAIKNVFAIASGMIEGLGLGDNARAALISRGMAEMMRLGEALGANRETLMGLSGLGDLILTCTSRQSRNYSLGLDLGKGRGIDDILATRHTVAEGYHTAHAAQALADRLSIDMPITRAVHQVVTASLSIEQAMAELLARPFTSEF